MPKTKMASTEIVQLLAQELIELYRDKHGTIKSLKQIGILSLIQALLKP